VNDHLSTGQVLRSSVSDAVLLVTDPGRAVERPTIDGVPLIRGGRQPCSKAVHTSGESDLFGGRRYADAVTGLTLLCIRPGRGPVLYCGRQLTPVSRSSRLGKRVTSSFAAT
jgi:hypothetical protein